MMKQNQTVIDNGDTYKRYEIAPNLYQCGCYWERQNGFGDVLVECIIHHQATVASVSKFERENKTITKYEKEI